MILSELMKLQKRTDTKRIEIAIYGKVVSITKILENGEQRHMNLTYEVIEGIGETIIARSIKENFIK